MDKQSSDNKPVGVKGNTMLNGDFLPRGGVALTSSIGSVSDSALVSEEEAIKKLRPFYMLDRRFVMIPTVILVVVLSLGALFAKANYNDIVSWVDETTPIVKIAKKSLVNLKILQKNKYGEWTLGGLDIFTDKKTRDAWNAKKKGTPSDIAAKKKKDKSILEEIAEGFIEQFGPRIPSFINPFGKTNPASPRPSEPTKPGDSTKGNNGTERSDSTGGKGTNGTGSTNGGNGTSGGNGGTSKPSDTIDLGEEREKINKAVADSMFRLQINLAPEFPNGTGTREKTGNINLINASTNKRQERLTIVLDSTNERIFQSDLVPPGNSLNEIDLTKELSVGVHKATATIDLYDLSGNHVWRTGAKLELYVYK